MIIKLIPETEEERATLNELEYSDVIEYFVFGSRKDAEGQIVDFHNWRGNHRYLMGSLDFYYNVVDDERRSRIMTTLDRGDRNDRGGRKFNLHKTVDAASQNLQVVEMPKNDTVEVTPEVPPPGFELDRED